MSKTEKDLAAIDEQLQAPSIKMPQYDIKGMIYVIRNQQVMVDNDLAMLYQVETKALNRAVKRNINRFPEDFCFQLTKEENKILKCQLGTSKILDAENFNAQYPPLGVNYTKVFHDRFLILDRKTAYHVGASLKDAGKKCFGINLIQDAGIIKDIVQRLELETEE